MRVVKLLHMADMHLEWPFAGIGIDGHRGRARREELKATFAAIVDLALAEKVHLFLIAGDLFEHQHVTRSTVRFLEQQFRRLGENVRVFISPGNHDPYMEGSYYRSYPWPENVHIFGPRVERVDLDDLGVSVYGWGFGSWEVDSCQLEGLRVADPDRINLLVVHGGEGRYHPFRPADLEATGADYVALGHIHKPGVFLEAGGRVIAPYPGSPEALSFGEPGRHGVIVAEVSKGGSALRFHATGKREFITREVDCTGALTPEDLVSALLAVDPEPARQTHCYRLTLTGTLPPDLAVDLPLLHERLAPHFYHLRLEDRTRPDYDLEQLAQERSARGLFVRRLLAMEAEGGDRERIRRALRLGLAAFEEGGGPR